MQFLFKLFSKRKVPKTIVEKLQEITLGDTVCVHFIDPKHMGYKNELHALSRFDQEDIDRGKVIGQVTNIRIDPIMDFYVLDITTAKAFGIVRNYVLIQNEIKEIKCFNKE